MRYFGRQPATASRPCCRRQSGQVGRWVRRDAVTALSVVLVDGQSLLHEQVIDVHAGKLDFGQVAAILAALVLKRADQDMLALDDSLEKVLGREASLRLLAPCLRCIDARQAESLAADSDMKAQVDVSDHGVSVDDADNRCAVGVEVALYAARQRRGGSKKHRTDSDEGELTGHPVYIAESGKRAICATTASFVGAAILMASSASCSIGAVPMLSVPPHAPNHAQAPSCGP